MRRSKGKKNKTKRKKSSCRIYEWRQSNSFFTLLRYGSLTFIFTFSDFCWRQLTIYMLALYIYLFIVLFLYNEWINDEGKKNTKRDHYPSRFLVIIVFEKKSSKKIQTLLPYLSKVEILTATVTPSVASIIVFVLSYE
jgi:hypothetical protein